MAFSEARAAWQRTANRCLVQEDAKRAPKLACCSSAPPSAKQNDTEATFTAGGQEIPNPISFPNWNASYSNLSPNSRWWLQLQPNYKCQKDMMDGRFNLLEPGTESCRMCECPEIPSKKETKCEIVYHCMQVEDSHNIQCKSFISCDKETFMGKNEESIALSSKKYEDPLMIALKEVTQESRDEDIVGGRVFKSCSTDSSWFGTEKTTLRWQTAGTEDLALLIAQRSRDLILNCDLPKPQNTCASKARSASSLVPMTDTLNRPSLNLYEYALDRQSAESTCKRLSISAESHITSSVEKPWRDGPMYKGKFEMHLCKNDARNAQLLEALRHSQTRAREAEKAAKQASAEKEHVLKLVLRQASLLFAYKQWIQLLQLESMYFQFKSNKSCPVSDVFPIMVPWISRRHRKIRKNMPNSEHGKWEKQFCFPQFCVGEYVVFALGLGLIGAGLLLGWTIGQLRPAW